YPMCAGVERYVIAEVAAEEAAKARAAAIAHGSTGAGNDQIRFDVAFGVLAPRLPVLVPVRELGLSRQAELDWLSSNGFSADFPKAEYSINEGLWGTTIGGKETKGSMGLPPEHAYAKTVSIENAPEKGVEIEIAFEKGVPISLNGQKLAPVALIDRLNAIAGEQGVGRGTHLGDTILGIKGRIAFEAPAAITLIAAHRELEKLVLTKQQAQLKEAAGSQYAALLHEGLYFDPVGRDLEALLSSSQQRVTGTVRAKLQKGSVIVIGSDSAYSLLSAKTAVYGEENRLWSGAEAAGFGKIWGMQSRLAGQAAKQDSVPGQTSGASKKSK
ncbi:MAG: argininosuccinate synthase, partial [Candidatus Micrarchaeota archaeon]|nr:argininosuccinate synthase [Candidatus Micrarchaeota archaeon]